MTQANGPGNEAQPDSGDFIFDESLIEWTVSKSDWLSIHNKSFDGVATAAIIFDSRDRVLLVQRAAHDSMPNLWETPGGAVDAEDASILHGCAREVREETGLVARKMRRLVTEGRGRGREEDEEEEEEEKEEDKGSVFVNSTGTRVICSFAFEVEVEDGGEVVLDPNEHQSWVWAGEEEVREGRILGGRRLPLSSLMVRNRLMEAFRLRRLEEKGEHL